MRWKLLKTKKHESIEKENFRLFTVGVFYKNSSRPIDKDIIKKAIEDYLDSVSEFSYIEIKVEEDHV